MVDIQKRSLETSYHDELALRIKRAKMAKSSFTFFRGNAKKFYNDLAQENCAMLENRNLLCWIQGDAHLYNLGFFNKFYPNSKEIRFDLNDFDEAFIGSLILDVVRFTTSITFLLEYIDLEDDKKCDFRKSLLKESYFEEYFLKKYLKYVSKNRIYKIKFNDKFMKYQYKKAKKILYNDFLKKSTIAKITKNQKKFAFNDNLKPINRKLKERIRERIYKLYGKKYHIIDIATRIGAGVGSANLKRYYALVENSKGITSVIEAKEQIKPSLVDTFKISKEFYEKEYKKYSYAKIYLQAVNKIVDNFDANLKVFNFEGKSYILKTLFNVRYTIDSKKICKKFDVKENLKSYIKNCAKVLANAHKKTALNYDDFIKDVKKLDKSLLLKISYRMYKKELKNYKLFLDKLPHK